MWIVDCLIGILGWSAALLLFSEPNFALTVTLAGLLAVHVARIAWLIRQRNLMLTLYQSTVTIVVGGAAGAIIVFLAYFTATSTSRLRCFPVSSCLLTSQSLRFCESS
jgi:hypothetical protein